MIAHVAINVSNYEKAKKFYLAALKPLGYEIVKDMPEWKVCGFGGKGRADFWIYGDQCSQGSHVAFAATGGKDVVEAFYKAAIAAGGKNNGAPGYEAKYSPGYYASFVYDLDGNNIEAVWIDPSKE